MAWQHSEFGGTEEYLNQDAGFDIVRESEAMTVIFSLPNIQLNFRGFYSFFLDKNWREIRIKDNIC